MIRELKANMLQNWDKRFPSLQLHYAAALLDPTTRQLRSLHQFLSDEKISESLFLLKLANELNISLDQFDVKTLTQLSDVSIIDTQQPSNSVQD